MHISTETRQNLSRLLAQTLAHASCGNADKAHAHKQALIDALHANIPHPATRA